MLVKRTDTKKNAPHFYSQFTADLERHRTMQNQQDLQRAVKTMQWNRFILKCVGLWPDPRFNIRYYMCFGYFGFCLILENLDLFPYLDDFEHVILNLTENIAFTQVFVKLCMLRIYNGELVELIAEASKDFDANCYRTVEERKAFTVYTDRARLFLKMLLGFTIFTAVSYYFTPILGQLQSGLPELRMSENTTGVLYILPYRFRILYPVEDIRTYVMTYAMCLPFPVIASLTHGASDSMMVTLVFHICGQMSMLALRITRIDIGSSKCQAEIHSLIKMHMRLLRMGKMVDQAFSVILLCHIVAATTLICTASYQLLTNVDSGDQAIMIKYIAMQLLLLIILYVHCFVGDALVTESSRVCEAFYDCKWYDMRIENARYIILCIARTQKPLCLTIGKFEILRFNTMTDVLKTSMAYLSVLRSFL